MTEEPRFISVGEIAAQLSARKISFAPWREIVQRLCDEFLAVLLRRSPALRRRWRRSG
jgi:hypothetical protein